MSRVRFDGITIAGIGFLLFLIANVVLDHFPSTPDWSKQTVGAVVDTIQTGGSKGAALAIQPAQTTTTNEAKTGELPLIQPLPKGQAGAIASAPDAAQPAVVLGQAEAKEVAPQNDAPASAPGDPNVFADPYDAYIVTQGPHGMSYGHYAVDLTGGKGVTIKSPINGIVGSLFVDQYGNTTLIIENDRYRVLMLHGNYSVHVGQVLAIGDPVGVEWNNGYTLDGNGQLCTGRDCGYHTHLNIFDKSIGQNVDPFTLLTR